MILKSSEGEIALLSHPLVADLLGVHVHVRVAED